MTAATCLDGVQRDFPEDAPFHTLPVGSLFGHTWGALTWVKTSNNATRNCRRLDDGFVGYVDLHERYNHFP